MYKRHVIGKRGEDIATEFLIKQGYNIIERNFQCKMGELDIIAKNKEYIVFVEVKTRSNNKFGMPVESITNKKLQSIYKTAKYYMHINNIKEKYTRIDAIEIYFKNSKYKINYIKQII